MDSMYSSAELRHELEQFRQGRTNVLAAYEARGTHVWGVFNTLSLVGAVALSPVYCDIKHRHLWLWGLYVKPRFRGTPVSRCLMRSAQIWAGAQQPGTAIIGTYHRDNRHAKQLVERFGFLESELEAKIRHDGLARPDDVVVEFRPAHGRLESAFPRPIP